MPVALAAGPANRHESTRLIGLIEDAQKVAADAGMAIRLVHADKGYDTDLIRSYLGARRMQDCIPRRAIGPGRAKGNRKDAVRHVVERFFAWLKCGFRRMSVRYERSQENYLALANIASFMMYFRVLG